MLPIIVKDYNDRNACIQPGQETQSLSTTFLKVERQVHRERKEYLCESGKHWCAIAQRCMEYKLLVAVPMQVSETFKKHYSCGEEGDSLVTQITNIWWERPAGGRLFNTRTLPKPETNEGRFDAQHVETVMNSVEGILRRYERCGVNWVALKYISTLEVFRLRAPRWDRGGS